jgi:hypothetical protein
VKYANVAGHKLSLSRSAETLGRRVSADVLLMPGWASAQN